MEQAITLVLCLVGVLALIVLMVRWKLDRYFTAPLSVDEADVLLCTLVKVLSTQSTANKLMVIDVYKKRLVTLMGKKNKAGHEALQVIYERLTADLK